MRATREPENEDDHDAESQTYEEVLLVWDDDCDDERMADVTADEDLQQRV